jgi:hypothetical protein
MNIAIQKYVQATILTGAALILGLLLQLQTVFHCSTGVYAGISICSFTIGTIGRLDFAHMTWGCNSPHEKLDRKLFLALYFIGAAAGIASLRPVELSDHARHTCSASERQRHWQPQHTPTRIVS